MIFFGPSKLVVEWVPSSLEVHVSTGGEKEWVIIHCSKAGKLPLGKNTNKKLQRWGCHFRTGHEASFFLKSAPIVRLGHGESQTIQVLVANEHSGKNVMQSITVNYDDAKTYLRNYTQAGIEYLTDIVGDKKNHRLDVWVSGETVLYLPAPLSNLDALHSMMVAQTFGKNKKSVSMDTTRINR